MALSVSELADRLGLNPSRVRALVSSGRIRAERVGRQWVIDEADAARYHPVGIAGRPLLEQNAWEFVCRFIDDVSHQPREADTAAWNSAIRRLQRLKAADDPLHVLTSLLARRAEKLVLSSSPADLAGLRDDPRIRLSGVSHPDSGLLTNSEVEAYVCRKDFDALVKDWLLVSVSAGRQPNVVLHVAEEVPDVLPPLLVAADLAERSGIREQEAARELIRSIHAD